METNLISMWEKSMNLKSVLEKRRHEWRRRGHGLKRINQSHEEASNRRMRAGSGPVVDANDAHDERLFPRLVRVYARLLGDGCRCIIWSPLKRGRERRAGDVTSMVGAWVGRLVSRILLEGYSLEIGRRRRRRDTWHTGFGKLLTRFSVHSRLHFPSWRLYPVQRYSLVKSSILFKFPLLIDSLVRSG